MENWKPVVGYESIYEVSDIGNVRSIDRIDNSGRRRKGKQLFLKKATNGYMVATLCNQGKMKCFLVHRLVLTAFVGNCKDGHEAMHLDGNKDNNVITNLRWGSHKENMHHQIIHGTARIGENHWKAKLTEQDIIKIRADNRTQECIAKDYGVLQSHISEIKRFIRWSHVR